MLTLDPAKLAIIGIVALVVLGPDKLPAAARKASSLLRDLQRLEDSLHQQLHGAVGDHPMVSELTELRDNLVRLRDQTDPRQVLSRSIGHGPEAQRSDLADHPVSQCGAEQSATPVVPGSTEGASSDAASQN